MDNSIFSILIVEDDVTDLDALNNILRSNYTVYSAKSGSAAIKRAEENQPDLILLDVIMPDISGFEVLKRLKESAVTKHIPVIFITCLSDVKDEEEGFRLGAVDYITKPFHSSIVKARVKSHLKVIKQLLDKDDISVTIETRKQTQKIFYNELIYVEVFGHYLTFHLVDNKSISIYSTMKAYEGILLADPRFRHCHRSIIVNMDFVEMVEIKDVRLCNEKLLPISKKYSDFKTRYLEWTNE